MWKYVRRFLHFAVIAALFMVGEVLMDLYQPGLMQRIVDDGVLGAANGGKGDLNIIWTLGAVMIVTVIVGGACGSLNNVFVHMCCQNIGNDVRKDCFRRIMTFSVFQTDRLGAGPLITRVTNDVTQVQNMVGQFIRGVVRMLMLTVGSLVCLYRLEKRFAVIVLCALPFMFACLIWCIRKANPLFARLQSELDQLNGILQEDISGIRIIKACVREAYEKLRFGRVNESMSRTQLRFLVIFALMNPVMNALMYLAVAGILLTGSVQVGTGSVSPGSVMAAITYTTQLLHGVLMVVMIFQMLSRGAASWTRLKEVLEMQPDLHDGAFTGETAERGEVRFEDVSFTYPGSRQQALRHIDLTVRSGETLAVIGPTGSGKSTLVGLIARFYDAAEGSVKVDGVDVKDYRQKDLRDKLGFVLQKSELFSATLGENIAWSEPEATAEQIAQAARTAQAESFVLAAPEGYDTPVTERGASLSGGQKQRIAIARAVLRPAEVLIFDDASSALDLKTEAALYDALSAARPECTKIIIAQRIATARRADRIAVMDHGTIAACGTHAELMADCGLYREIYRSQMGEEEEHE